MHLMNVHLNINCVLFSNKVQKQYLKEMINKGFDRKQTIPKTFLVNSENSYKMEKRKYLTVFEPKHLLRG